MRSQRRRKQNWLLTLHRAHTHTHNTQTHLLWWQTTDYAHTLSRSTIFFSNQSGLANYMLTTHWSPELVGTELKLRLIFSNISNYSQLLIIWRTGFRVRIWNQLENSTKMGCNRYVLCISRVWEWSLTDCTAIAIVIRYTDCERKNTLNHKTSAC